MVNQPIVNHGLGILWCGRSCPWAPPSRSNNSSLALVSCLSSGCKFASVLRCVGLVIFAFSGLCHAWFPVISRKSMYPIFTKLDVYWINSLHGIAFGEDGCIAE